MRGYRNTEKPAGIESYFILNVVEDIKDLVTGLGKQKFNLVAHDYFLDIRIQGKKIFNLSGIDFKNKHMNSVLKCFSTCLFAMFLTRSPWTSIRRSRSSRC